MYEFESNTYTQMYIKCAASVCESLEWIANVHSFSSLAESQKHGQAWVGSSPEKILPTCLSCKINICMIQ